MTKKAAPEPEITNLDFMFADEGSWNGSDYSYDPAFWHRSMADVEAVLDSEFAYEDPAPQATFAPDFNAESWKKTANFGEISTHVSDWAKYLSDPDEPLYLEIPFPEHFRESIRNQFRIDAGLALIRSSRSMREYFRYWSAYQAAVVTNASLVRPNSNANWNYGCSGILGLFILLFIVTGIKSDNLGGASFFAVLFGLGIVWLMRSGRRRVELRRQDFEDRVQRANSDLAKSRKKVMGFLERNGWYAPALDKVIAAAAELAENFIEEQEVILAKRRDANKFIDAPHSPKQIQGLMSDGATKAGPKKMERFSPRDYEIFCAGWVEYLGGENVRVTQQSADGGIDIVSDNEVAQVKLHGSPVSVQPIRELFGVSQSVSKTPLFFTSTGYTQAAITFAEANDVFLFIADPVNEDLKGVTEISRALKRTGLTLNRATDDVPLVFGNTEGNAHSGIDGYEDGHASDGYLNR